MTTRIAGTNIQNATITGDDIASNTITSTNLNSSVVALLGGSSPTITQIQITDSSYNVLDDTAVASTGGYIKITGTNFTAGSQVVIGSVAATSVGFVSATTLNVQVPAQAAGTYVVYVTTSNGSVAIRVNGLTYSGTPTWVTGSTLTSGQVDAAISIQLSATGDAPVTYALAAGSSLPAGLSLSSAGLLSGTVTGITVDTTYNFTIEAIDAEAQESPRAFSITISAGDANFEYVTTLLSASTPISTFVTDASTNAFAITVNGDARPSNFGPYTPGYYSNYFDGTGDYLSATAVESVGSGDFTIECWAYSSGSVANNGVWHLATTVLPGSQAGLAVAFYGSGGWQFYYNGNFTNGGSAVLANTWYHLAVVRSGTNLRLYVNGTSVISVTDSTNYTGQALAIGGYFNSSFLMTGYVSNFRIVKGTAVYTSNFTPPTAPLTAIANTSLLTCQSNRFIDNSTNNFTITSNGDVRVDGFDPFTPDSNFAGRGSGFFDGTGDYLNFTGGAATTIGTSSATVEFWMYATANDGYRRIVCSTTGGFSSGTFVIRFNNGSLLAGSGTNNITATLPVTNRWYHVAWVGVGGTSQTLYLDGVSVGTAGSYDITESIFLIGGYYSVTSSEWFAGYLSNFRIVKGTAVYTTTFTPPTTPLTAIANTSLLTLQNNQPNNNSMFLDSSTNNFNITRNGNTTQGSFSPYGGGWSNYFDGNGDSISYTGGSSLNFGTGDFTIETWAYLTNTGTFSAFLRPDDTGTFPEWGYDFSTGQLKFDARSGAIVATTTTMPTNQWVHVAVSRSGTSLRQFINGTQVGSTTTNSTNFGSTTGTIRIGGSGFSASHSVNGYLSNFRVVVGTAVYTSTFTPSTAPLTPIANTQLLTCADNRFIDDSANNFAITRNGDVRIQRFNPWNPVLTTPTSYSGYFDGTGDYLSVADNAALQMGSGDFTIEFWWYPASITSPAYQTPFDKGYTSTGALLLQTGSSDGRIIVYASGSTVITASTAVTVNAWNHMALVRNSTTLTLYLNGVSVGSATNSTNFNATNAVGIGANSSGGLGVGSYPINGYMSNMRVVKGTAVYTTNFTPPTAPLTAIANTSLLTLQSPTFVDNSTNNFTITANGNSVPRQFNPFGWTSTTSGPAAYTPALYSGSAYFDGTGDSLSLAGGPVFTLGSPPNDFTIECWVYLTTTPGNYAAFMTTWTDAATFYTNRWFLGIAASKITWYSSAGNIAIQDSVNVPLNQWIHVAAVRNGSTITLYKNGVALGTQTTEQDYTTNGGLTMGYAGTNSNYITGYISDARIFRGTALYKSNFQPPIAPLTALQNTVYLNSMTGAGIYDSSMITTYETAANASISTSLKKYGNTSLYFDGTGDYLFTLTSPNLTFGTGDFTVEMWLRTGTTADQIIFDMRPGGGNGAYPTLYYTGGSLVWFVSSANRITSSAIAQNTWYHVAVSRSGTSTRMFLDGVQTGSTYTDTTNYLCDRLFIGASASGGGTVGFLGYLDDVRITKGVARYTSNFTPPSSPVIQF